jgi:hypothetical protein
MMLFICPPALKWDSIWIEFNLDEQRLILLLCFGLLLTQIIKL